MSKKLKLRDFVEDENFIDSMNKAFSDLRADFELTMDADKSKIIELKKVHIDNNNNLENLVSYSQKSSGVLSGLRGTGKTHLFLLARDEINLNLERNKTLCIYINAKRIHFPSDSSEEVFNRVFSIYIYDQLSSQLKDMLSNKEDSLWKRLQGLFSSKEDLGKSIGKALLKLQEFKLIAYNGNEKFESLGEGAISIDAYNKELLLMQAKINAEIGIDNVSLGGGVSEESSVEFSESIKLNNTYLRYLNIESVRLQIIELLKILKLEAITFYVDEWEKLYHKPINQERMTFYIDKMIDTPIYFWIGIVPFRGELYHLDNGADLQHTINLDESLIYENSEVDKKLCTLYFKDFIDKRMMYYFDDEKYSHKLLFNADIRLDQLVLASMGNSRDFGTMLLSCWSNYKAYRTGKLSAGRPYSYISNDMIVKAIKANGDKKLSNIKEKESTFQVWKSLEKYCIDKKSSHFVIEDTKENIECINKEEFSDLLYHRLLHFRKGHLPAKDSITTNKLSLYALNYTSIYDLHAKDRKVEFIKEYKSIHDRVRRYIYDPKKILQDIEVKAGKVFPCKTCATPIDIEKMIHAWKTNSCPFCGGTIHN